MLEMIQKRHFMAPLTHDQQSTLRFPDGHIQVDQKTGTAP